MKAEFKTRLKRLGYIVGGLVFAGLITYGLAWMYPGTVLGIASLVLVILLIMLFKPPKLVRRSRLFVLGMLAVTIVIIIQAISFDDAEQAGLKAEKDQQLSMLKAVNPEAYLNELKVLGRDDEWLAALKKIRPDEYAAEKSRRDEQAKLEKIRRDEEAKQELALKEEQDQERRIKQLFENAKNEGRHGIKLSAADFKGIWNLSVLEGRLHCEQGPIYNGKPRPLILFDAGGITYGINGPAIGKGKYTNLRTITTQDASQTSTALISDHLISAGALMCRATQADARPQSGNGRQAYTFKLEKGAEISTSMDAVQEAVILVRANGYRCDSVLIMSKMAFKRGYTLICNQASYEYDIVDKGGNWTVQYVD